MIFQDETQWRELAKLLEACPAMKKTGGPELVKDQLPPVIQRRVHLPGSLCEDVFCITKTCAEHPDGLECLIRAVAYFDEGASAMNALWEELPRIMGFFVTEEGRDARVVHLLKFLSEKTCPIDRMRSAFAAVMPEYLRRDWGLHSVTEMGRWDIWRALSEVLDIEGRHPAMEFYHRVKAAIPDEQARRTLREWIESIAGRPVSAEGQGKDFSGTPVRLMLELMAHPDIPEKFHPGIYPCQGLERENQFSEERESGYSLAEVADILDRHLLRLRENPPEIIELTAPAEHIARLDPLPPEWWLKCNRKRPVRLGKRYVVLLRVNRCHVVDEQGRLQDAPVDCARLWNEKWALFRRRASDAPGTCFYAKKEEDSLDDLYDRFESNDTEPALIVGQAPETDDEPPWLGDLLRETGIPVALWGDAPPTAFTDLLAGNSAGGSVNLGKLPGRLHEARRNSVSSADALRISLLWDGPDGTDEPDPLGLE